MEKEQVKVSNETAKRHGNLLRTIRESAQLTMRQLGMRIGISHTAISQIEHGKLELPRYRVEQILSACGQTMDDFDRMVGSGFKILNYKDECISLIKSLDDETLKDLFGILHKIKINAVAGEMAMERKG